MCRWTLGGERHKYALHDLIELGTDPIATGRIYGHRREKREQGEKFVSKYQSQAG